jgi:hypothetical protein
MMSMDSDEAHRRAEALFKKDQQAPEGQPLSDEVVLFFLSGRMDRWTCDLDCERAQLGSVDCEPSCSLILPE